MELYLAKIDFNGDIDFKLVKANSKKEAEEKVRKIYYGFVSVEISDIIE